MHIVLQIALGLIVTMLLAPFAKRSLMANPDRPNKFAIFLEALPSRGYLVLQGGRVAYTVIGGKDGPKKPEGWKWLPFGWLLYLYRLYVWHVAGLHFVIPFFFLVYSYALNHRFRVGEGEGEEVGKKVFKSVQPGTVGYRSNHVRTEPEIWYFKFTGIEIETVPFAVKGGATYKIDEDKIALAMFSINWAEQLDLALSSTTRQIARKGVTLDMVIGKIAKDLWDDDQDDGDKPDFYMNVQKKVTAEVRKYQVEPSVRKLNNPDGTTKREGVPAKKLDDFGMKVTRVDIFDFEPELSDTDKARLQSAALKRQEARGRALDGQGRAEEKAKILKAIEEHEDLAPIILQSDAVVDAAANGNLNALLATWIAEKMMKGTN